MFDLVTEIGFGLTLKLNLLVNYNGTVRHLKACKIRIEGAWESRKGREEGNPC